jgi:predicted outer membrane repeat protein
MRSWGQNTKVLTALKILARMGVFKNSCETAGGGIEVEGSASVTLDPIWRR